MKMYALFDPVTGLFSGETIGGSQRVIEMNIPEGMAAIEGAYDHLSQRVDVAAIVYERGELSAISNTLSLLPEVRASARILKAENASVIDYQPPSPGDDYEWIHDDSEGNRVRRWLKKPEVVAIETAKAKAMARITELELDDQPRAMREAVIALLGRDNQAASRLVAIDDEIAMQRAELSPAIKSTTSVP